jgi:hypothetical protein
MTNTSGRNIHTDCYFLDGTTIEYINDEYQIGDISCLRKNRKFSNVFPNYSEQSIIKDIITFPWNKKINEFAIQTGGNNKEQLYKDLNGRVYKLSNNKRKYIKQTGGVINDGIDVIAITNHDNSNIYYTISDNTNKILIDSSELNVFDGKNETEKLSTFIKLKFK